MNAMVQTDHKDHLTRSSSSPRYRWKHDVFLNFRGADTRQNFVSHLDAALIGERIKVFKDENTIRVGRSIFLSIFKAIEESRISIVVFSANYGQSDSCLDELVKILEFRETKDRYVYPVFYHVLPSEVKHQTGCFEEGFAVHGNHKKVDVWRNALVEATNIKGIVVHGNSNESDCIVGIVEIILKELGPRMFPLRSLIPKASAHWCLSFLSHRGVPQAGTAVIVSSSPRTNPKEPGAMVSDQLYKSVHIGKLNGNVVSIKEIHTSDMRESDSLFLNDVSVRSRMKHENVATLFGYCTKDHRRFLVEEHATHGTLHQILHGEGSTMLSLTQRIKIVYDVAKGLEYLHHQIRLGHIDSSNVLLFRDFDGKISTGCPASEHYRAPEYNGELTLKGEVYSFGVLLLELLTGRKPSEGIVKSVLPTVKVDNVGPLVDPKLNGKYVPRQAKKLAFAISLATMDQPSNRPDMNTIVEYLKNLRVAQ